MTQVKPLIFVTNDDGITAPGIRALIEVMNTLGNVVVVAPDEVHSGKGHAVTIHNPLFLDRIKINNGKQIEFQTNGMPVDCVKLGLAHAVDRKPDLLVSGLNHGVNNSINVLYSGTMGAAIEGAIEGIPSIGFTLDNYDWEADLSTAKKFIKIIAEQVLQNGLPKGIALNVNIPYLPENEIKGIKIARQALDKWDEKYDKRTNPFGKDYYWLNGNFTYEDKGTDTDVYALKNGYVSIVPVQFDLTSHQTIDKLKKLKW
jgi:5'-nucleotidase